MEMVSVVVPTYNQADYLRACLDSLWFQDYGNIEIILVNDGSTDGTSGIIETFLKDLLEDETSFLSSYDEEQDLLLRTWHKRYPEHGRTILNVPHPENRGLAASLNTGLRMVSGKYCTYVPSDNICYPNMLDALVESLENTKADFAYSDMLIVDDTMTVLRGFELPDYSFQESFADWYLCGVSKLYKSELHRRFGYYDETLLAHDHELFQKFAMGGVNFTHVAKYLMAVRAHEGDREVEIHSPDNWNRLLLESKELVKKGRNWMREGKNG